MINESVELKEKFEMKDYIIYKQFCKEDIKEGDLLRGDLIDWFNIKGIKRF